MQIREDVVIGCQCIVGKNVYVDFGVHIGDRCKIQNNVSVFHGATLEDGVFIGPHVCFTNDRIPRAISPNGELKGNDDWEVGPITLRYGSSIGAASVILPGVTVGRFAMVGSGAVVTRDVPDHGLVVGNPARLVGYVCACGGRLAFVVDPTEKQVAGNAVQSGEVDVQPTASMICARCGDLTVVPQVMNPRGR